MGHYAAEMFITGSRDGDERLFAEERRKDQQNGKAIYNRLLGETELTIDLKTLKKGDWLRMKSRFLETPALIEWEEKAGYVPYMYAMWWEALSDKFSEWNFFKKKKLGIVDTPFVVVKVDRQKKIVHFMPRWLGGTTAEMKYHMFRGNGEEYSYTLDARMLDYFAGHPMQTIKVKDSLIENFSELTWEERFLIKEIPATQLIEKYGEHSLKELVDLFRK